MKTLFLLLLFPIFCLSQTLKNCPTVLHEKDFIENGNNFEIKSKPLYLIDASEECVKTKFQFTSNKRQFSYLNINQINMMIIYANIEVMTKLKNKYSYIPKRVDFTYNEYFSKWIISIDYLAQNSYGGTVNNIAEILFTNSGEFYSSELK